MKNLVRRTCTDISGGGRDRESSGLESFRETGAYVLLGAPGSGKTTEFDREAGESGGVFVTARDFLTFDRDAEWRGATLFIDALDETRAGSTDGRTALDAIRAKLARLGCPKFRLSCREADWFGANDRHHLEAVSPVGSVRVLHLDPLTERDAEDLLKQRFGVEEPDTFIGSAHERGMDGMLVNPQSLGFLARAVRQSAWPSTRKETFELACANLVRERNPGHRIAVPQVADTGALMGAAGKLFAVQLLAGAAGYERLGGEGIGDYLALEDVADGNADGLRRVLATRLFVAPEGERALPLHRQIAEFLAARYLAERIEDGLPVGRVLALMTGFDGAIVTELRGLCAWLAAQSSRSRTNIIARDPLGTVMYGDVQGFTSGEKRLILDHLERGAKENPWLVGTIRIDTRLGDLVFPDLGEVFRERTRDSQRDDGRQAFVYLLLEMFAHGRPVEGVAERMLEMVRDVRWRSEIRYSAIKAYARQQGNGARALDGLKALARDVYEGAVADPDDNLLGTLLDKEVSRREVYKRIEGNESLQRELDRRLDELKASEQVEPKALGKPPQRLDERQRKWQDRVRASEVELLENRADARLLHELAQAYLGGYWSVAGGTPRERLNHLIGDVEELVEAVLTGFRGALSREDLPSDDEVIRLGAGQRMHVLSFPFLAGLNEVQPETVVLDGGAGGRLARLALALHYNVGVWPGSWGKADGRPWWYGKLLEEHPELVADVLIRSARSILRKGRDFSQHLFDLAYSADHKTVACLAVEPLLGVFPVRCTAHQLASLRYLLVAACLCCEREALVELVDRKLASRSMNVAQRVYWLGAGLIVRPARFVARLESYVEGKERRVLRLSQFLGGRNDTPRVLIEQLNAGALALLVRTIGALHHPYSLNTDSEEGIIVTSGMEAADRVHGLINLLASDASAEASAELERMSLQEGLDAWHAQLVDAKSRQKGIRRDASFVHASVGQVLDVLKDGKPANASDLAAVTMDHLRQIAGCTQDENSRGQLRYWNVDPYNRAERPRPENACRDALLYDLQRRLGTMGIDVQPEGRYADEKRADIRIAYGGFNVPIEIKKSCHPDLWSGIRRQLIARYTRDPGADGHGIYVVLWFGDTEHCQPTPGVGGIPTSAADVEQRLLEELSDEQRQKIGVCLIDVAKPDRTRSQGVVQETTS